MKKLSLLVLTMFFFVVLVSCRDGITGNDSISDNVNNNKIEDINFKYWNRDNSDEYFIVKYNGIEEDFNHIIEELKKEKAEESCECIREHNFQSGDIILSFDNPSKNKMHIRVKEKNMYKDYYLNTDSKLVNKIQDFYNKSMDSIKNNSTEVVEVKDEKILIKFYSLCLRNGYVALESYENKDIIDFEKCLNKLKEERIFPDTVKLVKPVGINKGNIELLISKEVLDLELGENKFVILLENGKEYTYELNNEDLFKDIKKTYERILLEKEAVEEIDNLYR